MEAQKEIVDFEVAMFAYDVKNISCSTTALGCVITGLTAGSAYYVDMVASNSAGTCGPSAMKPRYKVIAGTAPSATPTSVATSKPRLSAPQAV